MCGPRSLARQGKLGFLEGKTRAGMGRIFDGGGMKRNQGPGVGLGISFDR